MGNKYGKITKKSYILNGRKNLKIKLMRKYIASFLFIHLTFGVWANREELFLLRTAQKGIENFPHLDSMSLSIYFNRRWHAVLPDLV